MEQALYVRFGRHNRALITCERSVEVASDHMTELFGVLSDGIEQPPGKRREPPSRGWSLRNVRKIRVAAALKHALVVGESERLCCMRAAQAS